MAAAFEKIRFIGFAIPTGPANMQRLSLTLPLSTGSYLGNENGIADAIARVAIMKNAVDTAKAKLPANEVGVINVFVAPEFYFHSVHGPYLVNGDSPDPYVALAEYLSAVFKSDDYRNWIFFFGSVVTSQIDSIMNLFASGNVVARNNVVQALCTNYNNSYGNTQAIIGQNLTDFISSCHSSPQCIVRNRILIVSNVPVSTMQDNAPAVSLMSVEKYYISSIDFLVFDATGNNSITEQMTAYSPIDITGGDLKQSQMDPYAVFRLSEGSDVGGSTSLNMTFGVEVCLDHADLRLRQNLLNDRLKGNQSAPIGIHTQIIPSCGMQILLDSIAADINGFVFNCDGGCMLSLPDNKGKGNVSGVNCLYAQYTYSENANYAAHSQLARVKTPAIGDNPSNMLSKSAVCYDFESEDITILTITPLEINDTYFAGGAGEVHIFGLNDPYLIYPQITPAK